MTSIIFSNAMPHPESNNDSSAISKGLYDLDLPEVAPDEVPLPHPEPSFALQMEHALFLLKARGPDFYEKRLATMNPEPFHIP